MNPLRRRALVMRVEQLARRAGRHDERGTLGSFGTAWLQDVRRRALVAGCALVDVDDATMTGLEAGRKDSVAS